MNESKIIADAFSGEIIERPLNIEELAQKEIDKKRADERLQEVNKAQAKREVALAKLATLGFDEDDLKALGL